MKILLATPLYPPEIGGPAQYAYHLYEEFKKRGHSVRVITYGLERKLPPVVRHIYYFFRIILSVFWAQKILAFDASSVGFPTAVASTLLRKKYIVRIGGDFLWESYIERTNTKISLPDFYQSKIHLSRKERIVKQAIFYTLWKADKIAVNSVWLKNILCTGYGVRDEKIKCIENYFEPITIYPYSNPRRFFASARSIRLKNIQSLITVFESGEFDKKDIQLITKQINHEQLQTTLKESYVTIIPSYSDVNPNLIMEGISKGKPFIVTKYNGLPSRFLEMGIQIDPFNRSSMESAIVTMLDEKKYVKYVERIKSCTYAHSWAEIAIEFETILQ